LIARPRWKLCACRNVLQEAASQDAKANFYRGERRNQKKEGTYIDKDGVARTFDRKKISRKRGNDSATKHSFTFNQSCKSRSLRPFFIEYIPVIFLGLTVSLQVQEGYSFRFSL
jgi:hypothetical protein